MTPGTTADCSQAGDLIAGIAADHLLADRGYDTNAVLEQAARQGMNPVIPPKKAQSHQRLASEWGIIFLVKMRGFSGKWRKRCSIS
jgi:hypothetical protein